MPKSPMLDVLLLRMSGDKLGEYTMWSDVFKKSVLISFIENLKKGSDSDTIDIPREESDALFYAVKRVPKMNIVALRTMLLAAFSEKDFGKGVFRGSLTEDGNCHREIYAYEGTDIVDVIIDALNYNALKENESGEFRVEVIKRDGWTSVKATIGICCAALFDTSLLKS